MIVEKEGEEVGEKGCGAERPTGGETFPLLYFPAFCCCLRRQMSRPVRGTSATSVGSLRILEFSEHIPRNFPRHEIDAYWI